MHRRGSLLMVGSLLLAFTVRTAAQSPPEASAGDFKAIFAGKVMPLQRRLKDLNEESWRRITITTENEQTFAQLLIRMMTGSPQSLNASFYHEDFFTPMQTLALGGETYLVAYRIYAQHTVVRGNLAQPASATLHFEKITGETPLSLSLLNVKHIRNIDLIRPYDFQEILAENRREEEAHRKTVVERERALCRANLQTISNANQAFRVKNGAYTKVLEKLKLDLGEIPRCPAGGKYTITLNEVVADGFTVHCSLPEHDSGEGGQNGFTPGVTTR